MKKLALLLAVSLLSVAAFAQSPVGSWKGKIKLDTASMPVPADPQQKAQMEKVLAQVQSMTFTMQLKANKTFVVNVPSIMGQPASTSEGTWTQKGKAITMTTTKRQGKPATDKKTQTMTMSANGKQMVLVSGDGPQKATITFTR